MTFKPSIWYPIAVVLCVLNLAGIAFAVWPGEPWHATTHAVLALAFALWAQRLRQRRGGRERGFEPEALEARGAPDVVGTADAAEALPAPDALQALEEEVGLLRQELSEAQERLDFAERVLAREPETRRAERQD